MITSPVHSIVNFNDPVEYCGEERDFPLPAPSGVGFQFLIDIDSQYNDPNSLTLGICSPDCDPLSSDNLLQSEPNCYQYEWIRSGYSSPVFPGAEDYPVLVGDCGDGVDPFLPIGATYDSEEELLAAISEVLGITISDTESFVSCCRLREVCIRLRDVNLSFYSIFLNEYLYSAVFQAESLDISPYVDNGDCFRYCIYHEGELLGCSNLFKRQDDECYTTTIKYWCNDPAFGFNYQNGAYNLIRVPMYLSMPNFPLEEKVYKRSNGTYRRQNAIIEKEWDTITDYLPEWLHQRLVVALKHDHVQITNTNAGIEETELSQQGNYELQWNEDNSRIFAQANFKFRIPIAGINRNCRNSTACCVPTSVTIEYDNESDSTGPTHGTGKIYFQVGDNSTAVQIRFRLSTETAWTTEAIWATASPYEFENMPITSCGGLYYEVQIRSVCNTVYSPWSESKILYHPDPCSYPEVTSVVGYANSGGGFVINLADDELIDSYDYEVLDSGMGVVVTGNTTGQSINVPTAGADTYTFTITANCGSDACQILGEVTYTPYTVTEWETTEV